MYSTYQQYQQRGGQLPESVYLAKAQRASEIIDYYTMGKAATAKNMKEQLSACESELADRLAGGSFSSSGIQSFNNDGYSETYKNNAEQKNDLITILKQYLTFPENLLVICGYAFI